MDTSRLVLWSSSRDFIFHLHIQANYSLYMSVAILATIDSIFGAVKSQD